MSTGAEAVEPTRHGGWGDIVLRLRQSLVLRSPSGLTRMHLAFRDSPYDLFAVVGVSLVLIPFVALELEGPVRMGLSVVFTLFAPGYALVSLLFPKEGDIRWIERIALSVGLSIATVMLLALVVTHSPAGFRVSSVFPMMLGATLALAFGAYHRRIALAPMERLSLFVDLTLPRWRTLTPSDRNLAVVLVVALILAAGLAAVPRNPAVSGGFSEFYLLDSRGGVSEYPSVLNASQEGTVRVGIVNHHQTSMNYSLEVRLITISYEGSLTVEQSTMTLDTFAVRLEGSAQWELPYTFRIVDPGDYHLRFLLFEGIPQGVPDQFLNLPLVVV